MGLQGMCQKESEQVHKGKAKRQGCKEKKGKEANRQGGEKKAGKETDRKARTDVVSRRRYPNLQHGLWDVPHPGLDQEGADLRLGRQRRRPTRPGPDLALGTPDRTDIL